MPRRTLINLIQVEEKLADSTGSYEDEEALPKPQPDEQLQQASSIKRHNDKIALDYGYGEGNYDGPKKEHVKVKKDKPQYLLDVPIFDKKGHVNLPVFRFEK